ncbi:MAG TPA: preprotein translocase subunit YajC [Gammaproteobacteria bacterium]
MDFLLANAYAQTANQGNPNPMETVPWLIAMFVIFYFLLIRPQQKRVKEHRNLVASLKKGDEVLTNGGLLGRLTEIGDHFVTLEIAANVEVRLQRQAIAAVMPKGTLKNISNN